MSAALEVPDLSRLVKVRETDDKEEAWRIMTTPEMWSRIAVDGEEICDFEPEDIPDDYRMLIIDTPHGTAGLYIFHPRDVFETSWQLHAHMLEAFRGRYTAASSPKVMQWAFDNLPAHAENLAAIVPLCFQEVIAYVERNGFKDEGYVKETVMRDGKEIRQRIFVIKRGDWVHGHS